MKSTCFLFVMKKSFLSIQSCSWSFNGKIYRRFIETWIACVRRLKSSPMNVIHLIHSRTNAELNLASSPLINTATTSASADQIQWPTLYSSMENMSLQDQRLQRRQQRSERISTPVTMQNYNDQQSPRIINSANNRYGNHSFRSQGHGRSAPSHTQNSSNNNFYRQTSVAPRILNSSCTNEQRSNQTSSAFFGSGSNVGRGRPMTGDR